MRVLSQNLIREGVSEQVRSAHLPSPKPTFCPKKEVSVNAELREGWVVY